MMILYKDADNLVVWDKMKDLYDDSYINSATVTMTLVDADGDDVSGAVDLPMAYVGNSNGKYAGTIPSTVSLTIGGRYFLEITAVAAHRDGFRRIPCRCQYRGA